MQHRPVHWTEGMFLRPQHFQAGDRYWHELLATAQQFDQPYNYGLRRVEISDEALSNGHVQVTRLQARLQDGTVLDLEGGQVPDRLNLQPVFATETETMVYLSVPKLRLGRPNLEATYDEVVLKVPEESRGGNEQELGFREQRVTLSTTEMPGFESLPLVKVRRSGADGSTPAIDDDFFPPMICVEAWKPLQIDLIRELFDFLGNNVRLFAERARESRLSFATQDEQAVRTMMTLNVANQAYAVLHGMTFARGLHPLTVYIELLRIMGMLSIFGTERQPPDGIPEYNHDDLATIFRWVDTKIRELLGTPGGGPLYEQRAFEGRRLGMRVKIKPEWLHDGWEWFVGVRGRNVTKDECQRLLEPGVLNWKLGSDARVDLLFEHANLAVRQEFVEHPPTILPIHQNWIFYKIIRDKKGLAWRDVISEESLAMRFAEPYVGNKEELPGQRFLEVSERNKQSTLEFALFAVPPTRVK